jgi:hypothetical protein
VMFCARRFRPSSQPATLRRHHAAMTGHLRACSARLHVPPARPTRPVRGCSTPRAHPDGTPARHVAPIATAVRILSSAGGSELQASRSQVVHLVATSHASPNAAADIAHLVSSLRCVATLCPAESCFVSESTESFNSRLWRPSTVAVESCPSRLSLFLSKHTLAALWVFDTIHVTGVPDMPGHPSARELTERLTSLAGELVSCDTVTADAQALLATGLFDEVAVEVVQPRFYGLSSALQPVGRAQAMRFVTTPRRLVGDFERYVVAIAPELAGYDAAYAPIVPQDDLKPHVPWLPAFQAAFEALHDADAQEALSPLHLCCLVRHAVCVAGSEHMPPAKPVALRFEQDDEAAPYALIVGIDVPDEAAVARMRALPADATPYDVWRAATEDAFALHTTDVANDVRAALTVPSPAPARRRRPHMARRQAAQYAALDALLGQIGMLPFEFLSAIAAWRLRVAPGDDMRSAVASAVRCDARRIVLVDRPVRATVRRTGTELRRLLSAVCITAALLAFGLACIPGSMPTMSALYFLACGVAAIGSLAAAFMCAAVAALAVAPAAMVARLMTPPLEAPTHAPAALIAERDACMVSHLQSLASTGRTLAHASQLARTAHGSSVVYVLSRGASEEACDESGPTVAVVGAAHLHGILARWRACGMTAVTG